jgi:ubiquinone/menaquinone biosynthesis C-methylase UbiE
VKQIDELRFKRWLDNNANKILEDVGVKSGQTVLDFGCGSGTYTIPAAKIVGESGLVYALDISNMALDKMEKRADREGLKNIVRIDALSEMDIRLEDASIDHVLLIDVLQEIDTRAALFDKIYRVLKPSGVVTIYPMHIAVEEVTKLVLKRPFALKEKKFEDRILVFNKLQV